ncbi:NeuD/PglB/VioB family sugar acetyltransferase [Polynucleobacter sp. JS-JIR-5-A7]|uniref:NeuD/PglB/VioB family sugar acetyltransferase n=1 Tax=Polynucleobacter sp. JS-JIR-5-A7 TaxID=1758395 RepID=UPI001BFEBA37|nr:NeuD/PglB/VioB family sugar acetyltransferase [Polynucleobacter sp. JS-JIR-5-A7]QWE06936.1 NeuD/PglB/VioB family sugar acetyltransferase [Polynucleobacter sp. JS-JIR-5-A7]
MIKKNIILIGSGGHAISCIDVIESGQLYEIAGLVGMPEELNTWVSGYPILGTDDKLFELAKSFRCAHISIGQIKNPDIKINCFNYALGMGFELPPIISPLAYVSPNASVGSGTIVMHGAIVNAGATIGHNCIINSNSLIEHGVSIGNHCHISTATVLNGDVSVDDEVFIGSGTLVKQGLKIGKRSVIGIGSIVTKNINFGNYSI